MLPQGGASRRNYYEEYIIKSFYLCDHVHNGVFWFRFECCEGGSRVSDRNSCGLDVALVLDHSGSIDAGELTTMKGAFNDFVTALFPTPTLFSVVKFDGSAQTVFEFGDDAGANAATLKSTINGIGVGQNATDWEAGLNEAAGNFSPEPSSHPDLIIFASDGNPNHNSSGSVSEPTALASAVSVANTIKAGGTTILTVGIGGGSGEDQALDLDNLDAISTSGTTYDSDFDTLASDLADIATAQCAGTLTITKEVNPGARLQAGSSLSMAILKTRIQQTKPQD
ncbi:MAG: vWA domain-containing protein [bacterium]